MNRNKNGNSGLWEEAKNSAYLIQKSPEISRRLQTFPQVVVGWFFNLVCLWLFLFLYHHCIVPLLFDSFLGLVWFGNPHKKKKKDPEFANPSFEIGFVFKIKSSIYFKIARSAQNVGYATKRIWAQSNNLSTFSPPIGQQLLNIFLYADCWHARVKDEVIELIFSPPFSMAEWGLEPCPLLTVFSIPWAILFSSLYIWFFPTLSPAPQNPPCLPSWVIDLSQTPSRDIESQNFLPPSLPWPATIYSKVSSQGWRGRTEPRSGHIGSRYCPLV